MGNTELASHLKELNVNLKWAQTLIKQLKKSTLCQDAANLELFIEKTSEANDHMSSFCTTIDNILNEPEDGEEDDDDTDIDVVNDEPEIDVEHVDERDQLLTSTPALLNTEGNSSTNSSLESDNCKEDQMFFHNYSCFFLFFFVFWFCFCFCFRCFCLCFCNLFLFLILDNFMITCMGII